MGGGPPPRAKLQHVCFWTPYLESLHLSSSLLIVIFHQFLSVWRKNISFLSLGSRKHYLKMLNASDCAWWLCSWTIREDCCICYSAIFIAACAHQRTRPNFGLRSDDNCSFCFLGQLLHSSSRAVFFCLMRASDVLIVNCALCNIYFYILANVRWIDSRNCESTVNTLSGIASAVWWTDLNDSCLCYSLRWRKWMCPNGVTKMLKCWRWASTFFHQMRLGCRLLASDTANFLKFLEDVELLSLLLRHVSWDRRLLLQGTQWYQVEVNVSTYVQKS